MYVTFRMLQDIFHDETFWRKRVALRNVFWHLRSYFLMFSKHLWVFKKYASWINVVYKNDCISGDWIKRNFIFQWFFIVYYHPKFRGKKIIAVYSRLKFISNSMEINLLELSTHILNLLIRQIQLNNSRKKYKE